ncbi:MAG: hypothetical protein AAB876_02425 [Patescibacteria group bacterium]
MPDKKKHNFRIVNFANETIKIVNEVSTNMSWWFLNITGIHKPSRTNRDIPKEISEHYIETFLTPGAGRPSDQTAIKNGKK